MQLFFYLVFKLKETTYYVYFCSFVFFYITESRLKIRKSN